MELRLEHIDRLIELVVKYSDRPMDLADGSLIVSSEQLDLRHILMIDADYYIHRTKGKAPFQNLLADLI